MGFRVSTVYSVSCSFNKYIYVVGEQEFLSDFTKKFLSDFDLLGKRIGVQNVIVQGYDSHVTNELSNILFKVNENANHKLSFSQLEKSTFIFVFNTNPIKLSTDDEFDMWDFAELKEIYMDDASEFEKDLVNYVCYDDQTLINKTKGHCLKRIIKLGSKVFSFANGKH